MKVRLLVVEDEENLRNSIKRGLKEAGYAVDGTGDGEEGLHLAENEPYDCIVLDIMLPNLNGLDLCRRIREKNIRTPVLMLTANNSIEDITTGLDSGADDYLTKPFSFAELKSRIAALIRRGQPETSMILKVADLVMDPVKHTVYRRNNKIDLTPKEFSILEYMLRHKNEAVTRTMIIEHVWDINYDSMSNVVDVFMATLRKKIDKNSKSKLILTIHGVGFKISDK